MIAGMATHSDMAAALPAAVLGLTDYLEKVVSRPLLKRSGGAITAFAFNEGQSLGEHTAPFDAIVHVLEGRAAVTIGGTPHEVSAGEIVLIPAGQPHAVRALTRFKMLLTTIRSA